MDRHEVRAIGNGVERTCTRGPDVSGNRTKAAIAVDLAVRVNEHWTLLVKTAYPRWRSGHTDHVSRTAEEAREVVH
jgi:hypothetical protein